MAYDPDLGEVVLVGGRHVQEAVAGMWTWNGTTWTERTNVGLPASPHFSVQLGYDVQRSELVYCGVGNSGSTPDQTLVWTGTTWFDTGVVCPTEINVNSNRMAYHGVVVLHVGGAAALDPGMARVGIRRRRTSRPRRGASRASCPDGTSIVMIGGQQGLALVSDPQQVVRVGASWSWSAETLTATSLSR